MNSGPISVGHTLTGRMAGTVAVGSSQAVPRSTLIDPDGKIALDRVSSAAEQVRKAIANLGPEYATALAAPH